MDEAQAANGDAAAALRAENAALRARIADLEAQLTALRGGAVQAPASSVPPSLPPTSPSPSTSPPRTLPPVPAVPTVDSGAREGLENFVGRNIVPFAGALAVLVGIAILVAYAIDAGLFGRLPAELRFVLGLVAGALLLGGGEFVRRRGAPGAAVGLDAAGVGAFLVTIAIGVFSLGLFGPVAGSIMALGAGGFGAVWSVRTRSATVGVIALLGLFTVPVGFDLFRESNLLAGLQLTLALAAGLGMHALAGERFRAARYLALAATALLGVVWIHSGIGALTGTGVALLWWVLVAGELFLCAIRGRDRRENQILLTYASVMLAFVQGVGWWSTRPVVQPESWAPIVAGALLLCGAFVLRGFTAGGETDGEDAASPEGDEAIAVDACCGALATTALVLGLSLVLGGVALFVPIEFRAVYFAAIAILFGALSERLAIKSFLAPTVLYAAAAMTTVIAALVVGTPRGADRIDVSLPFLPAGLVSIGWTAAVGGSVLAAAMLLGARAARVGLAAGIVLAAAGAVAWIATMVPVFDGPTTFAAFAIPAIVIALVPRAPRTTVVTGVALAALGGVGWTIRALVANGNEPWEHEALICYEGVLPVAAMLALARHEALAPVRVWALGAAFLFTGLATAIVAVVLGRAAGALGVDLPLFGMIATGASGAIACAVGSAVGSRSLRDAGSLLALVGIMAASSVGIGGIFATSDAGQGNPIVALIAVGVAGIAFLSVARAWRSPGAHESHEDRDAASGAQLRFVGAVVVGTSIGPIGALLFSTLFGWPLAAVIAAGWLALAAIGLFAIGFRFALAALRWAGLATSFLLLLRLFLIDLRETNVLVRIGLLIVSGMILVAVGIVYARRAAHDERRSAPPPLPPPPPSD
jgi:hypothetical protein